MDIEEEQHWLVLQQLLGGKASQLRRLLALSKFPGEILAAEDVRWLTAGADSEVLRARRGWQAGALDRARRGL